ncbi:Uncharacterized protein dnl_37600 [Desulfonema limicola]|uniref:Uncharacterized protein n=1 Tax=Desulfonema limicola TaxID=45656 RepID=A0A975BA77_9BACT|nr:hypothetical protein [Desulfonema limicola]QTA81425.1 Uncharacterized protein dnl_37600 [Desulfonema limicola]
MKNFKNKLTDKYCRGRGRRFKNISCRYTDFVMLYNSVDRHLENTLVYDNAALDIKNNILKNVILF